MTCSDFDGTFESFTPTEKPEKIYIEKFKIKEIANGHHCRSEDVEGNEITHTKEMTDGRLFLYYDDEHYDYYQVNSCPFCGYKAKKQIL